MSDMPGSGVESDHFITVDDHILFAHDKVEETLEHIGDAFIRELDSLESTEFKLLAEKLLRVAEYDNIDSETLETARRSFFFGKLIGFIVLQRSSKSIDYIGDHTHTEESERNELERLDVLVVGSRCELRDSPLFKGFVDRHKPILDPSGDRNDVVNLFAGFSLFVMQNALYFASDLERMQAAGDAMAEASEEDWQQGLDRLIGDE